MLAAPPQPGPRLLIQEARSECSSSSGCSAAPQRPAPAVRSGGGLYVVTAPDGIPVRRTPDPGSGALGRLPCGTWVCIGERVAHCGQVVSALRFSAWADGCWVSLCGPKGEQLAAPAPGSPAASDCSSELPSARSSTAPARSSRGSSGSGDDDDAARAMEELDPTYAAIAEWAARRRRWRRLRSSSQRRQGGHATAYSVGGREIPRAVVLVTGLRHRGFLNGSRCLVVGRHGCAARWAGPAGGVVHVQHWGRIHAVRGSNVIPLPHGAATDEEADGGSTAGTAAVTAAAAAAVLLIQSRPRLLAAPRHGGWGRRRSTHAAIPPAAGAGPRSPMRAPQCSWCWGVLDARDRGREPRECGRCARLCCAPCLSAYGRRCAHCASHAAKVAGAAQHPADPLALMLREATGLAAPGGALNCYARARATLHGGEPAAGDARWPVIWDCPEPSWRTSRELHSAAAEVATVSIRLWQADEQGAQDVLLGGVDVPLAALPAGQTRTVRLSVPRTGGAQPSGSPPQLTLQVLPKPPLLKQVFFVRHGQSRWNAAKAEGMAGGVKCLQEVDHALSPEGRDQAERLAAEVGRVVAGGAVTESEAILSAAEAVVASPLTRALQTCLIGMRHLCAHIKSRQAAAGSSPDCPPRASSSVVLSRYAREKRNFGGKDTTGTAVGEGILQRFAAETAELYPWDPDVPKRLLSAGVDVSAVRHRWWDERAEKKAGFTERLDELTNQLRYAPEEVIVVVGHSHCFRELTKRILAPGAAVRGATAEQLKDAKLCNCGVLHLVLDFGADPQCPATHASLVFGTTLVGGEDAGDTQQVFSPIGRERWVPERSVAGCTDCGALFTITFRRHHCRACGGVYCGDCTATRVAYHGLSGPERICGKCLAAAA